MGLRSIALLLRLVSEPAAVEHVALQWDAPPQCPDAAAVHRAIAAMVVDTPRADLPRPRVAARVQADAERFTLTLELASSRGTRTRSLIASQCAALVDAVAIEVALLIEAEAAAPMIESPPPEPLEPPRDVSATLPPPRPATPRPPPAIRRPAWRLRGGIVTGASVIESAFVAPTLGAVAVGRHWSGAIDLALWPRGEASVPGSTLRGARLSLPTATFTGCGRQGGGRFAIAACTGLELGALVARGVGLTDARRVASPSVALVLGPAFELGVSRRVIASVAPWIRLGLRRPGIAIDGVGELARPRIWAFGATLRLEVEIVGRKPSPRSITPRDSP